MRNTLLRMLAALMCVLSACAEIMPVKDFDLQRVRQGEMLHHIDWYYNYINHFGKLSKSYF